ncbi:hypothetical protein IBL26_06055 [Roseomonas aerophila]|uniref:Cyclase dehydrase n=2 Tax=Teichococcus aerophilus TaxID=1224513 RepID=A0ABR7RJT2_9PROT|nr:hypothetical protein [Pseudoroseomonas aerophila]
MNMLMKSARSPGDPRVISTGPGTLASPDQLARGLGWFSIGLGMLELFGAHRVARTLGLEGSEWMIRACGAREIGSGVACLSVNPAPGVAARIAGDALDIATLAVAAQQDDPRRGNAQLALLAVLGITVLDVICHQGLTARHARQPGPGRDYRDRSGFPKGLAHARNAQV